MRIKKSNPTAKPPANAAGRISLREDAIRLFSTLNPLLSPETGRVIQFISANPAEGTSTLAREFAIVASQYVDGPVLLLDLDWGRGQHYETFQQTLDEPMGRPGEALDLEIDFSHLLRLSRNHATTATLDKLMTLHRIGDSNLHVSRQLFAPNTPPPHVIHQPHFWQDLRCKVSLTVVDCPPANDHLDGILIGGMMDSVILVVAAETTRVSVVKNLRDQLLNQQAPLAGMVLNKQRLYIPSYVHRELAL